VKEWYQDHTHTHTHTHTHSVITLGKLGVVKNMIHRCFARWEVYLSNFYSFNFFYICFNFHSFYLV